MSNNSVVSEINYYLHEASVIAAKWLEPRLRRLDPRNWWDTAVMSKLSTLQYNTLQGNQITTLEGLDLAALLRVMRNNWYALGNLEWLPSYEKDSIYRMQKVRVTWAHLPTTLPPKSQILADLGTCIDFFTNFGGRQELIERAKAYKAAFAKGEASSESVPVVEPAPQPSVIVHNNKQALQKTSFAVGDVVALRSDPEMKGVVIAAIPLGTMVQYTVFCDNQARIFYEEQLISTSIDETLESATVEALQNYLTAQQLRNPAAEHLYSLNSARVDFVPYQFRPALKMIKADRPRILVADSVGVGKTIEAGLLLRELQARNEDFESVLIICPKPLVAEHKWKNEMKRFDESFTELDGPQLRLALKDCDLDGEWPLMHRKTILPFSLLSDDLVNGKNGLMSLNPPVRFDLVIVDEAHHVRHSDTQAYKAVKYFCDNADAVVLLTATPVQTSEDDLYTLLNLLRPDIVLDKKTYSTMTEPNIAINAAIRSIRNAGADWITETLGHLRSAADTSWGRSFLAANPTYKKAVALLADGADINREQRISLLGDVEGLHTFASMINRTRRQDIQDFCIRRTITLEANFSSEQQALYDALMEFEAKSLAMLHPGTPLEFMMNMLMRQASSCIFGLAPMLNSIVQRRLQDLAEDYGDDYFDVDTLADPVDFGTLEDDFMVIAKKIIRLSETLCPNDEKLDCLLSAIAEKQLQPNNKIILFSAFRHTLNYIEKHLREKGYRVAQVNGSVKDEMRVSLREKFELSREHPDALDILLFTEVGCEGLDYQFCNMMINYDLPWNPMAIEQRIGRIDRRGQQSDSVTICNIITNGTIDAKVYMRCLSRIGIFENSIGECSSILGNITREIHDIIFDPSLTASERDYKLEKMADNEVSKLQEMKRLESDQRELFGFDLSGYVMDQQVADAENLWITPTCIEALVTQYLNELLGPGSYILGEKGQKTLRLSKENRDLLYEELKKAGFKRSATLEQWRKYLRGSEAIIQITFDQTIAGKNRKSVFLNPVHPLVKMAANKMGTAPSLKVNLVTRKEDIGLPCGQYPFFILQWAYSGVKPQAKLVLLSDTMLTMKDFYDVVEMSTNREISAKQSEAAWSALDAITHQKWQEALVVHKKQTEEMCQFRKAAYLKNYESRLASLQTQLSNTTDDKLIRMRQSQIARLKEEKTRKLNELESVIRHSDILVSKLVQGIITIE